MSNRISTAPPNPGIPAAPLDPATGRRASARHRWGARRKVLVASLVALALVLTIAGAYAWRIVSALNDSQGSAIVPLPTQSSDFAYVVPSKTPTETAEAGAAATSTPSPLPVATSAAVDETPAPDATIAFASTNTPAPTATPVATTASAATTTSSDAAPSPAAVETAPAGQAPLVTSEDLSSLEIAQEIMTAGMGGGDPGESDVWQGRSFLNILVLGVDKRPDGGDQNSDVIILARIDLVDKTVNAVSLPRDLLVEVPGLYTGKINGAYNAGVAERPDDKAAGVVKVRDIVSALYGVQIDVYVLIDFNGFEAVIDAVGGVDVNVPAMIVDPEYPTEDYGTKEVVFLPGDQHMDGERALEYVRTRNADNDDARRERQIKVLLALFDQGKSFDSIRRADELIVALSDTVQTNLGIAQQLTLARVAREVDRADITLTTLGEPLIYGDYNADGAWVYFSDPAEVAAFIDESLEAGTTPLPGS